MRSPTSLRAILFSVFGLLALPLGSAEGSVPGERSPEVRFLVPEQVVWLERSQVIAFELSHPAAEEHELVVDVSHPERVAVLRTPRVLAGATTGFLRVRGLRAGEAVLSVGDAELRLAVEPLAAEAEIHLPSARITTPAAGAVVWGELHVGVEAVSGAKGLAPDALRLRLDDGRLLAPEPEVGGEGGPVRRYCFTVDASSAPDGPLELVVELEQPGGTHIESAPVRVLVAHPGPDEVLVVECEDTVDAERPQAFGERAPPVGASPEASGAGFVFNEFADPTWLVPVTVQEAGRYQAVVIARGDFGAGAHPSIALVQGDPNSGLTTARVIDHRWRRTPLGHPVALEAGEHTLGVRYTNDSTLSATSDRNLYLDRFELLRVDGAAAVGGMMMMDAAMMDAAAEEMGGAGRATGRLWIAFDRPLDGQPINGRLRIQGYCRWEGMGGSPPHVSLLINGERAGSQRAAAPLFALDPAAFEAGPNRLQLVASFPDGRRAATPEQTVHLGFDPGPRPARDFQRFSVLDPRWDAAVRPLLSDQQRESGQRAVRADREARIALALPAELAGDFDLILDARGPDNPQPAGRVTVTLARDGTEEAVHEARVQNWWSPREAGRVLLEPGEKTVVLDLAPGEPREDGAGNSALWIAAVILRERREEADRTPPSARLLYPADGHVAHGADAVVVEAFDDEGLQSADLLVDGRAQGTFARVPEGAGHVVLPLVLRELTPGAHTLAVRLRDQAGNLGESRTLRFEVAVEAPTERGPYARAVRLLDRFAFGPDDRELAAILTLGEREWLAERMALRGAGDEAALDLALAQRGEQFFYDLERSVLAHALRTPNPVRTRFVLWTENHFSTWIGKVNQPTEWRTHVQWLELGPAPFGELLAHSATSAAMLVYLDQAESYAGRLNENYAREIMELHTVGVDGGYTQAEVTSLAGLLTGLTVSAEAPTDGRSGYLMREFRFDPELGDGAAREILGMRFERAPAASRYDRFHLALETLAAHPSTARHVARKLAEHYVSVPAPERLVDDLTRVFTASGGDPRALLLAIAEHPDFWAADAPPRLAHPLDFALRLGRATDLFQVSWALGAYLRRSGMGMFDRATPDGYPEEDQAWVDTNALLQRWRVANDIPWAVRQLVPDEMRRAPAGEVERWRQRMVDVAAIRLTGRPLDEESNAAALAWLDEAGGQPWQQGDRAALMVTRLPEASLK